MRHGRERAYRNGCRCAACTSFHNAMQRRRRKARAKTAPEENAELAHGTISTYSNYGCRCEPCSAAQRARMNAYREARRAV